MQLVVDLFIYLIDKDIDLIRLSIDLDIESNKAFSFIRNHFTDFEESEYTKKETNIISEIKEKADEHFQKLKNKENKRGFWPFKRN